MGQTNCEFRCVERRRSAGPERWLSARTYAARRCRPQPDVVLARRQVSARTAARVGKSVIIVTVARVEDLADYPCRYLPAAADEGDSVADRVAGRR